MAVASVTQWQPTPGKRQQFLSNVAEARKIHERLGGRVRVLLNAYGGPDSGRVGYIIEHDDLAALARFSQQAQADAAWQQFWARVNSPEAGATMVANSLLVEPPGQPSPGRAGGALVVTILRPAPGRLQESLASFAEGRKLVEAAGGRVRLWQAVYAGPQSGNLVVTAEADDLAGVVATRQKLQASGDWGRFQDQLGAAGHTTVVSQSVLVELPTG